MSSPRPSRKLQVTLVDDDPTIVRILAHMLQQQLGDEIDFVGFTDALACRDWLDGHCCDLLLSDIEMPGLDGLRMLRFAKQRNSWTQVVILTATSTWDRLEAAIEAGASDYLLKPIDREALIEVVRQAEARFGRWQLAAHGTLTQ